MATGNKQKTQASCPVHLAYQLPASSIFLSEQNSHQQPANSTFISEQTSTSHQPSAKRTVNAEDAGEVGRRAAPPRLLLQTERMTNKTLIIFPVLCPTFLLHSFFSAKVEKLKRGQDRRERERKLSEILEFQPLLCGLESSTV
jgi:hypothetical protein